MKGMNDGEEIRQNDHIGRTLIITLLPNYFSAHSESAMDICSSLTLPFPKRILVSFRTKNSMRKGERMLMNISHSIFFPNSANLRATMQLCKTHFGIYKTNVFLLMNVKQFVPLIQQFALHPRVSFQ